IAPTRQVVWALDWLRLIVTIGGKLARGRGLSRRNLVCGRSTWDQNHDAAMRIGSEAPRGGPNLLVGIEAMWGNGTPPPRIVIGHPSRVSDERPNSFHECAGSDRRTYGEPLRDVARPHQAPQGNQQLSRQGHDHGFARFGRLRGPFAEPLRQGALALEHQKAPRQLDHAPAHPRIASLGLPALASPFSRRLAPLSSGAPVKPA